jgi:hypothetical protein
MPGLAEEEDLLPIGQALSRDYVAEHMVMTDFRNETDPGYGFRIFIPRGWEQEPSDGVGETVSGMQFGPLLSVRDSGGSRGPVVFTVHAVELEHDLRALALWEYHGRRLGQRPLTRRELSPFFVDSLMAKTLEDEELRIRQGFYLSGRRAFILSGIATEELYPEFAEHFGLMVASFKPASEPDHPGVNAWVEAGLGEGLSFRYPESWNLRRIDVEGGTVVRLHWNDSDGRLKSQMSLEREARQLPEALAFELMVRALGEAGLEMSEEFDSMTFGVSDSPLSAQAGRVYRAVQAEQSRAWTVRLLLFNLDGESLRVWQVQPERDDDFLEWAASIRAMEIVLSTLTLDE